MVARAIGFVCKCKSVIDDEAAQRKEGSKDKVRWMPPEMGIYKVNSNAVVFEDGKVG